MKKEEKSPKIRFVHIIDILIFLLIMITLSIGRCSGNEAEILQPA